jgi:hypothetical protein
VAVKIVAQPVIRRTRRLFRIEQLLPEKASLAEYKQGTGFLPR